MIVIPAVDIKGGRCVRLEQGEADRETVYGDDPAAAALRWADAGAQRIHVVDLDGAFEGRQVNADAIGEILAKVAATGPGQLVISKTALDLLEMPSILSVRELGSVAVRGRQESIELKIIEEK